MDAIARLEGGLLLRRGTAADAEAIAAFNAFVHSPPDRPDPAIAAWPRELLTRPHPTFGEGGFLVVEDPARGADDRIVSSLNLIPQTWTYGGVPFGVGQVELVGTHPEYRRRGLIRVQMEEVHRWSAGLGHPVQIILGISNFYRQFGYEQGLTVAGSRSGYRHAIPSLRPGAAEPFRLRPATPGDAEFLAEVEAPARARSLLSVPRDAALWRHELAGPADDHITRRRIFIVEAAPSAPGATGAPGATLPAGDRAGYVVTSRSCAPTLTVTAYDLVPGLSWLAVTPSVLRGLRELGDAYVARSPEETGQRFDRLRFELGLDHPVYHTVPGLLSMIARQGLQYVRVQDVASFVRHVAPVLERRLGHSLAVGHTGSLRLSFYRDGLLLRFDGGRLSGAEPCLHHAPVAEAGPIGASFPDLTFLQLLFGSRSLEELEHSFGDCRVRSDDAQALLTALFPKQPSLIWPIS